MFRPGLVLISRKNLLHNISIIRNHLHISNPNKSTPQIIAMVKANAYGHGIVQISKWLANEVAYLGVASTDEALILRRNAITTPIIVMQGFYCAEELLIAIKEDLHMVIHSEYQLKLIDQLNLDKVRLNLWLKIDTGMSRGGLSLNNNLDRAYEFLQNHKNVNNPINLMSHFSESNDFASLFNQEQIRKFKDFVDGKKGLKSMANSSAIFNFPDSHFDIVRPGLALYGYNTMILQDQVSYSLKESLKPVMSLKTKIINIKNIKKGTKVGYNGLFIAPEDMRIGNISIGYADGYLRQLLLPNTPVLIKGKHRAYVIGAISMDVATIDLRNYPEAQELDEVLIFGEELHLQEITKCPYQLLVSMGLRMEYQWT